ncbi:hypothetical protein ABZT26_25835 [Streptomyces sp. NPDC005395]|uniref:hypothetical protein n=1 Tax=Streptomyces sp. NPDC005395 TaxID=3157042 RepID=UPI0033A87091
MLLVITRTANPDSAAISARALPPDVRAAFADLLRLGTGVVTSDGIRAQLGLTDYRFRKVRKALVQAGYLVHRSAPVDGGWQHLYAVTDMAGTLPATGDLDAMADRVREGETGHPGTSEITGRADETGQAGMSDSGTREDESGQAGTSESDVRPDGRGESTPGTTCDDDGFVPENRDVDSRRRTGSGSPRRGEAEAVGVPARVVEDETRAGGEPVEPVGGQPAKTGGGSVVGSLAALERLAALPERSRPPMAGPLWISNRGCLKEARTHETETVEAGLSLLASLELPFWLAPKTWALIESGWSLDRLRALFTESLEGARSVRAVCEKRLMLAVPDVDGGLPVDDPAPGPAPWVGQQIDQAAQAWETPSPAPGAAPWDLPQHQWRSRSNVGAPTYEQTRREMEAVDPGEASLNNDHMRASLAEIRQTVAANSSGRARHRRKVETYARS